MLTTYGNISKSTSSGKTNTHKHTQTHTRTHTRTNIDVEEEADEEKELAGDGDCAANGGVQQAGAAGVTGSQARVAGAGETKRGAGVVTH